MDAIKQLSLVEQVAIEAVQSDIMRLQTKLRQVLEGCGLNPNVSYMIHPDGAVFPANTEGH